MSPATLPSRDQSRLRYLMKYTRKGLSAAALTAAAQGAAA